MGPFQLVASLTSPTLTASDLWDDDQADPAIKAACKLIEGSDRPKCNQTGAFVLLALAFSGLFEAEDY